MSELPRARALSTQTVAPIREAIRRGVLTVSLAIFAACHEGPVSGEKLPPATLELVTSQTSLVAARGSNALITIRALRSGDSTGAVALSVASLPVGVTAMFTRASLAAQGDSSILALEVDGTAPAGVFSFMIRAIGNTGLRDSTTISLIVPTPSIALTVGAANATNTVVRPGSSPLAIPVALSRFNGFHGTVTLSTSTNSPNVSATVQPATLTTGMLSTAVVVSSTAAAENGPVTIAVTASGAGVADVTATHTITVAAESRLFTNESRLTVVAGGHVQQAVTLQRQGHLDRSVIVAVRGLPPTITASLTPGIVTSTQTFTALTLTIDVSADVPAGVYPFEMTSAFSNSDIGQSTYRLELQVIRNNDVR